MNKNIISYFSTAKMLFVILYTTSCKKMNHPSFLVYFGKLKRIRVIVRYELKFSQCHFEI